MTTTTEHLTEAPPSTLRPASVGGGYHVLRVPDDPTPGDPSWDDVLGLIRQGWEMLENVQVEDFSLVVMAHDDDSY